MPASPTTKFKSVVTILTFLGLLGLAIGLRRQIFDTINNLGDINALALPSIVLWQGLSYHSYTKLYQDFFAILNQKVEYKPMLRTLVELNFVNTVFPSGGVSGFSYFGVRMRSQGIGAGMATLVQMMRFVMVFVSFQILLGLGLFMLALSGQVSNLTILVAGSLVTLLFVGTLILGFVIGSKKRIDIFFTVITRAVNKIINIVRPKHPETINVGKVRGLFSDLHENYLIIRSDWGALKRPLQHSLVANLAEIMTIYTVYIAFGHLINPGAVIIAYAVANFAGLISVLPGGVGIYEGLMTAVLASAGVSPAISLPVTVTYRIVSMSLQLPVGYFFYHRTLHGRNTNS